MPARRQRSRSSDIACAVSATIGTCVVPPCSTSRSRINAVAAKPSSCSVYVHQDRVELLQLAGGDGLLAGARQASRGAGALEDVDRERLIDVVVLGQQQMRPFGRLVALRAPRNRAPRCTGVGCRCRSCRVIRRARAHRVRGVRPSGVGHASVCPTCRPDRKRRRMRSGRAPSARRSADRTGRPACAESPRYRVLARCSRPQADRPR